MALKTGCAAAEQWLDPTANCASSRNPWLLRWSSWMKLSFAVCPGSIAIYRAGQALMLGNVPDTLKYARQVLDLAPEDDYSWAGSGSSALRGLPTGQSGISRPRYRLYADGMAWLQKAGNIADVARLHPRPGRYPDHARSSP